MMATFAQASFNASSYSAFRPTYPPRLINIIVNYHTKNGHRTGGTSNALDLGCGTGKYHLEDDCWTGADVRVRFLGQVTTMLPRYFDAVIGTDPSKGMIERATELSKSSVTPSKLRYLVASAESVSTQVEPKSVDLVTAGMPHHAIYHVPQNTSDMSSSRTGSTLV